MENLADFIRERRRVEKWEAHDLTDAHPSLMVIVSQLLSLFDSISCCRTSPITHYWSTMPTGQGRPSLPTNQSKRGLWQYIKDHLYLAGAAVDATVKNDAVEKEIGLDAVCWLFVGIEGTHFRTHGSIAPMAQSSLRPRQFLAPFLFYISHRS